MCVVKRTHESEQICAGSDPHLLQVRLLGAGPLVRGHVLQGALVLRKRALALLRAVTEGAKCQRGWQGRARSDSLLQCNRNVTHEQTADVSRIWGASRTFCSRLSAFFFCFSRSFSASADSIWLAEMAMPPEARSSCFLSSCERHGRDRVFLGGVKVQVSNAVCSRKGPRAHAPPIATDQPVMKGVQASISMFSGPKMRDIGAAARARGGWGFVAQSAGNRNRARKSGPDARTRARAHHAP